MQRIDDDWAGWVQAKKGHIKEKLKYSPIVIKTKNPEHFLSNDNCTHNENFEYERPGEIFKSGGDDQKLEGESNPSVSEMFKLKKAKLAEKLEERKEKRKRQDDLKENELTVESTKIIKSERKTIIKAGKKENVKGNSQKMKENVMKKKEEKKSD